MTKLETSRAWRAMSCAVLLTLGGTFAAAGCSSSDCSDEIAAAEPFLKDPSNLVCESDADCQVVQTGCHEFRGFACGQAELNTAAASSAKWSSLQSGLLNCQKNCTQCLVGLLAQCMAGFCGGAPQ
ncbi:MAG TPA: hypothetical protein VIK01_05880 [Polyangiaceae bacterium]